MQNADEKTAGAVPLRDIKVGKRVAEICRCPFQPTRMNMGQIVPSPLKQTAVQRSCYWSGLVWKIQQ